MRGSSLWKVFLWSLCAGGHRVAGAAGEREKYRAQYDTPGGGGFSNAPRVISGISVLTPTLRIGTHQLPSSHRLGCGSSSRGPIFRSSAKHLSFERLPEGVKAAPR